jgi:ferric-dicitrate binding protein FerR (iron transport regulator)
MRPTVLAVLLAVTLVACGDDGSSAPATTGVVGTTSAVTTVAPTSAAPSTAVATTAIPTTAAAATTTSVAPPTATPTTVDVGRIEVNADTDPVRTVTVPLGTPVSLTVRTATAQEFHLHGYDLSLAGTEVLFQLTADRTGSFELESHDTGQLLLVLEVA